MQRMTRKVWSNSKNRSDIVLRLRENIEEKKTRCFLVTSLPRLWFLLVTKYYLGVGHRGPYTSCGILLSLPCCYAMIYSSPIRDLRVRLLLWNFECGTYFPTYNVLPLVCLEENLMLLFSRFFSAYLFHPKSVLSSFVPSRSHLYPINRKHNILCFSLLFSIFKSEFKHGKKESTDYALIRFRNLKVK